MGLGKSSSGSLSESSSESSRGSSSSSGSGDGWSWDIDKFFSKLFGADERSSSTQPGQNRSQSQSRPPPQAQPQPQQNPTNRPPPRGPPPSTSQRPNPHQTQSRPATTSYHTAPPRQQAPSPRPPPPRQQPPTASSNGGGSSSSITSLTLEELMKARTDPSTLPIKSIKTILDHHCVTYVGVVEKRDLVERLQKLIDNTKAEQEMVKAQEAGVSSATSSAGGSSGGGDSDNLCKICCDAALNCVMLNCNHMATCMDWYVALGQPWTVRICFPPTSRIVTTYRALSLFSCESIAAS